VAEAAGRAEAKAEELIRLFGSDERVTRLIEEVRRSAASVRQAAEVLMTIVRKSKESRRWH
jgi:hypothetical protein